MKVLISVPHLHKGGGVANYFRVLRQKFTVDAVYIVRGSNEGEASILTTGLRMLKDYMRFFFTLYRQQYDLVHINTSLGRKGFIRDSLFLIIAHVLRRKSVVFFRGWNWQFANQLRGIARWYFHLTFGRADAMIVLAEDFRRELREWGYQGRIYLETTVVDDALLTLNLNESKATDRFTFLFLARIEKAKGIMEVIQAFHTLCNEQLEIPLQLIVAGDGAALPMAQAYAKKHALSNVTFAGYVRGDEKAAVFSNADVYLLPTRHAEGMPNAVLEAMAFGLPIITSPVGGLKDFFEDRKMGFLSDDTSASTLAMLMKQLILDDNQREAMSSYNVDYAKDRFLATPVCHRLEKIYREVTVNE